MNVFQFGNIREMKTILDYEGADLLYKALSEQALDAFYIHDDEGRFIDVNEQACKYLGYTKEEILNLVVSDLEQDKTLDELKASFALLQPGERFVTHGHHRRKDGTIFPVEIRFGCASWKSRKVFVGFVYDISAREKAAEERQRSEMILRESEARFRGVFESANVGKSITLLTGEMYVNQAFSDMLGYSREELQMKSWRDITPPEDIPTLEKLIMPLVNGTGDQMRVIKRYIHKDGSFIWTDVSGVLKKDDQGKGIYIIATIINITDRIKAEQALEELNRQLESRVQQRTMELKMANKELQAFSYSVSHDLKAPLRSMRTYACILEEDYAHNMDEKGKRYLSNIRKSADRMDTLINDLLNLSHVTKSDLMYEVTDMREIVENMYYELARDDERKSFQFEIGNLPKAYCDSSLLRQVWQNLIGNALKYSSKSEIKKIEITGSEDKNEVSYIIRDYGAGFDDKYSKKVFVAFQRLHSTEDFTGNGIGLAIVQQIITRHGGQITAKGESGKGATFTFTLPKHKNKELKKPKVIKLSE